MHSPLLKNAIDLRSSGQYRAALSVLAADDLKAEPESEDHRQLMLEIFLCNVLSHNFNTVMELAALISNENLTWPENDTDMFRLLYAYARFHTDIDLTAALEISTEIFDKHLRYTEPSEFQSFHILLLCFGTIIAHLGSTFFGRLDDQFLRKLEDLRVYLLQNGQYGDLGMVHLAEAKCLDPHEQIQHLQATMNTYGLRNIDLEVHLKVLQLNACYAMGDSQTADQLVSDLWSSSLVDHNCERHLWAQSLEVEYTSESSKVDDELEKLDNSAELQGTSELKQRVGFLLARRHLEKGIVKQYMEDTFVLLKKSQLCKFPKSPADLSELIQIHNTTKLSQSAWLFWRQYMNNVAEDMKTQPRRPLAVRCVQTFFEVHTECTIPELRYTLTTVPAECYEEIGDKHQVLHWRALGAEIAKDCDDEDIKDEAECNLRVALAGDTVIILDDPHGARQKSWNAANLLDLELLYENTKKREKWKYAFRYARDLFLKEVDAAVVQGLPPTSGNWYANMLEAFSHLDDADQLAYRPHILFDLARAKFDCEDYVSCIEDLEEIIKISKVAKNRSVERMALFTSARAKLHLYQSDHQTSSWSSGNEKLNHCLALCEQEQQLDWVACCHTLKAALWYAKRDCDDNAPQNTLYHITQVQKLWTEEMRPLVSNLKLDNLLTKYALSGRNAKAPYSIFSMAVDICAALGDHHQAWSWIEYSKARALHESLKHIEDEQSYPQIEEIETDDQLFKHFPTDQAVILVHWMIIGERILLCISQDSTSYTSWELNCTRSAVEEWYDSLVASKEDLSDPGTADEILLELQELVWPLIDLATKKEDAIFILCPTQIIFKIPVHAIPVNGKCLLELVPVVYTHSFAVLRRLIEQNSSGLHRDIRESEFFASPTGDTPAGSEVVSKIVAKFGGQQHVDKVSKEEFLKIASESSWIHFHGHVMPDDHPLNQALLFHDGEKLAAREVFKMELATKRPVILLIGCGSGVERLDPGDEPLGLVSGLLFAGAFSVIATMWPIHDRLSGAKFSEHFYDTACNETLKFEETIDLARRVRAAALSIKENTLTQAPYFWAGFILYGQWNFKNANGENLKGKEQLGETMITC